MGGIFCRDFSITFDRWGGGARRAASSTILLGSEELVTWRTQLVHWQIAAPSFLLIFFRTCRSTKIRLLHHMMCKGQKLHPNIAFFLVNGVIYFSMVLCGVTFLSAKLSDFEGWKIHLAIPTLRRLITSQLDGLNGQLEMDPLSWKKHRTRPEDWLYMRYPEAWVFFGTGLEDRY